MKKNDNKQQSTDQEDFAIITSPNEPLINYRGLKFSTKTDLIVYKNQHFVNYNLKWMNVQTFKLYYDKKYYIQCLYIKNLNALNKREIIIFSQTFATNFSTILPFLIDLSNYLRINIITYQYNNKEKESMNYLDINLIYNYLDKLLFVKNIILMGLSVGNKINMNLILSKVNLYPKTKIKAIILISPTWVYNLADLKHLKNSVKIKNDVDKFIKNVNLYNIPVFIIHGKKDTTVKYFLSLSFSQQIKKKSEWFPKNGTHLDLVNAHRTKLLIRIKIFLKENDLLKKVANDQYLLSEIKMKDFNNSDATYEERNTAYFHEEESNFGKKRNKKNDDEYYGYYNNNDILGKNNKNKNNNIISTNNTNNNNKNDDGIITVCQPKIENENENQNDMTFDQTFQNVNTNINDMTLNNNKNQSKINNNDVTLFENNMNDITINENTIEYDNNETFNKMDVSFLPGDIIPSINHANTKKSIDLKSNENIENDVSFM